MDYGITESEAREERAAWLRRIEEAVLVQQQAAQAANVEKAGRAYVSALEAIHPVIATDEQSALAGADSDAATDDSGSADDDNPAVLPQSNGAAPSRLNGVISSRVFQVIEAHPGEWLTTPEIRDEMKRRDWLGKAADSGGTLRYALNSAKVRGLVEERQRDGRTKEFRMKPGVLRDARPTPPVDPGAAATLDFEGDSS